VARLGPNPISFAAFSSHTPAYRQMPPLTIKVTRRGLGGIYAFCNRCHNRQGGQAFLR